MPLNQREKERKVGIEGRIYENKEKKQVRRKSTKNQGRSSQKGGETWLYKQNQHHNSTKFN